MSNKGQLLQDPFLNTLRREHVPVSIYLVNGIKLQGQVESFDQYVVLLKNTVTQMVYKHAISTVVPARPALASNFMPPLKTTSTRDSLAMGELLSPSSRRMSGVVSNGAADGVNTERAARGCRR